MRLVNFSFLRETVWPLLLVVAVSNVACTSLLHAQGSTVMPTAQEISELVSKADETVTSFDRALAVSKEFLQEPEAGYEGQVKAAQTAHEIIQKIKSNGASAYALVALLGTLDDITNDSATSANLILVDALERSASGKPVTSLGVAVKLMQVKKSSYDISELIMHATLRLIKNEEDALFPLADQNK
jgi:hypothetical protein